MDRLSVVRQLCGHNWIFLKNGHSLIKMGDGGILALKFLESGRLASESEMSFLPDTQTWDFNSDQQLIELMNRSGKVALTLRLPIQEGRQVIMRDVNSNDQYSYFSNVDAILNLPLAPDPLVMENPSLGRQPVPVVLQLGQKESSPLKHSVRKLNVRMETLSIDLTLRQGWDSLYDYLTQHPEMDLIAAMTPEYQVLNAPFDSLVPDLLYLDDELEFMTLPNGRGEVMRLSGQMMIGTRSLLIEWVSAILMQTDSERLTPHTINWVAYTDFADRLVHGRQVTQKPSINSPQSWIQSPDIRRKRH
ncbi:hypothetical protein [Levilactobacillus bambusae]|uniref:Uncharacterized protein n=1 Tax=Levilactobacillus bambusae TaxID=2024736 RepID=A0A2V1MZR1_9LACO|nr:hypothetical protein [Levilactobacillus bambusae]PWF99644.1 hypothetical protein DCM90_07450 [Levilactobacillus bambusae]